MILILIILLNLAAIGLDTYTGFATGLNLEWFLAGLNVGALIMFLITTRVRRV